MSVRILQVFLASMLALVPAISACADLQAQPFGEDELHFPQVVFGGGSQTIFAVHNPNPGLLTIFHRFFDSDGNPVGGFQNFTVPPLGTHRLELSPDGPQTVGRMEFTSDLPFTATAFILLEVGGELRPLVGAQPAPLAIQTRFFGFFGQGTRSGMALANPEADSTTVSVRLFNSAGLVIRSHDFLLEGFHQRPVFLDELFPNLNSFEGVVDVRAMPLPVSLISLTQDAQGNIATVATVFPNDP